MLDKIRKSTDYINRSFGVSAEKAVVLGTGLGGFIDEVEIINSLNFSSIPGFISPSVEGHQGRLILASYNGTNLYILQGRLHFYEGLSMEELSFPIRVLKWLGVEKLILSNASGGMNPAYQVGDLMVITDHINLMPNPLIGQHYPEFGARFPDMSRAYDADFISLIKETFPDIHLGCYVAVTGPTYETPAEYQYMRIIGGDAVGMSTVPEVIVARQMGMRCFAISVITDLGVPGEIEYLTHEQVQIAAAAAEPKMASVVKAVLESEG